MKGQPRHPNPRPSKEPDRIVAICARPKHRSTAASLRPQKWPSTSEDDGRGWDFCRSGPRLRMKGQSTTSTPARPKSRIGSVPQPVPDRSTSASLRPQKRPSTSEDDGRGRDFCRSGPRPRMKGQSATSTLARPKSRIGSWLQPVPDRSTAASLRPQKWPSTSEDDGWRWGFCRSGPRPRMKGQSATSTPARPKSRIGSLQSVPDRE